MDYDSRYAYEGTYKSWGYAYDMFDEYYGDVNNKNEPHGLGVKWYADGSVYSGEWESGFRHTTGVGIWMRPDGSQYEGSWINDLKHGMGKQIFPDGSIYTGEFAKGLEHGAGKRTHTDGSKYEGKFRYGKKDGQVCSIYSYYYYLFFPFPSSFFSIIGKTDS